MCNIWSWWFLNILMKRVNLSWFWRHEYLYQIDRRIININIKIIDINKSNFQILRKNFQIYIINLKIEIIFIWINIQFINIFLYQNINILYINNHLLLKFCEYFIDYKLELIWSKNNNDWYLLNFVSIFIII